MLSSAVISCLIYFGTFGYTNENPSLINNRLQFDNYYDINMTTGSEVAHYHDRFLVDCDFALVPNENDNTINDVYVAFKSFTYQFYIVSNTADSETLNATYTNYFLNFDDCVLNDANNTWILSYDSYTTSGNYAYWNTDFRYYDAYYDESCGIRSQITLPNFPNLLPLTGTFRTNSFKVDLGSLTSQVKNAFNSAQGGYSRGYYQGYADGKDAGVNQGYQTGYTEGYAQGIQIDTTAFTIFNGILSIGMIPINVFLAMLNFEVFGINISNFVMSLVTLLITIWFIRLISGGNGGNNAPAGGGGKK